MRFDYNAEYLNPPLSPMLIIDRNGEVHQFKYSKKGVEKLFARVQSFLTHWSRLQIVFPSIFLGLLATHQADRDLTPVMQYAKLCYR